MAGLRNCILSLVSNLLSLHGAPVPLPVYTLLIYIIMCTLLNFIRYRFPSILLVYFLVSPIIFDVTYLIGLAGRDALFCRSSDLLETIENSTPFCSFTGLYHIARTYRILAVGL